MKYTNIVYGIIGSDPFAAYTVITGYPGTGTPAASISLSNESDELNPTWKLPFRANAICSNADRDTLNNANLPKYERHLLLQPGAMVHNQYKETTHYYNHKSQLIQSVTRYISSDSLHRISHSYTFTGALQSTIEEYNGISKRTDYTYDERCRLISETTTVSTNTTAQPGNASTNPSATITYGYDALGNLVSKTCGNGVTETINYNIQGWQTSIEVTNGSTNIYSQQLKYYNPTKGTTPLYSGNISEWSTTLANHQTNTYGFEYDKLSRLRNTTNYIGTATTPTNSYTERAITYDQNGNIQTLERYAANGTVPEDSYQYTYTGNKLTQITGTNNNAAIADATYTYDSNGNMTCDGLKNLQITYNILNLPEYISKSGTTVNYSWFADGSKYMVTSAGKGYRYTGSLIYTIDLGKLEIESTAFAGGRINFAEAGAGGTLTQDIHYFHTDHLGSVRAITNDNGETVEQNAYYPFGSRHTFGNTYAQTTNRFKFNGKEEQTSGNLGLLDYGARMYDANIGRWFVQDPLSEKYYSQSPYNYCVNNPVMFVDPDGRKIEISASTWDKILGLLGLNNYEKQVQKDIDQLKSMDSQLNDVIEALEKSKFTIYIKHTDERPDNKNGKKNNGNAFVRKYNLDKIVPMGGTLYYDPSNHINNIGENRPPIIGLAHEFGHAYNAITGKYCKYELAEVSKGNRTHIDNLNENEKYSIELENIIRKLLGVKQHKGKYYENNN